MVYQQGPTGAELGTLGCMKTIGQKKPCKAERNTRYHPKAFGDHPQAFGNTRQSGLLWASPLGKIPGKTGKGPHRARTLRQHLLGSIHQNFGRIRSTTTEL